MSSLDRTRMDLEQSGKNSSSDQRYEPRRLGEHRILRKLGEGGMGAVYLGYHARLKKQVALKVLADQYASNQSYIDRFYREAKSGALLNHPNIVRSLGVGQDKATRKYYMVLEYVDGPSALMLLERYRRLSVGDAVHITYDIARALEHAHSRNVIHRDIKPDNILITRSGVSKLADLGLAKRTDEVSHLTQTHQGFGTPYYMPYEQAVNARYADNRSDIYALGATLYHLLTGKLPFTGESHLDVVESKEKGEFLPASEQNPAVPRILDEILARMMARDPRDRYQTASELIVDLERSRLAAPVPSYADPDKALQDPWVRASMVTSAQPTQPDFGPVEEPQAAPTPAVTESSPTEQLWIIRYQEEKGKRRKLKLTTPQLAHRLRQQRIPAHAEARRDSEQQFQALSRHPDLRELLQQLQQAGIQLPGQDERKLPFAPNGRSTKKQRRHAVPDEGESIQSYQNTILFGTLGAVLLVALVLILLFLNQTA